MIIIGTMRWIKITFLLTALFMTVCVLAAALLALTLDDEDYRLLAVRAMQRWTGCGVSVDGRFEVNLSMTPTLSASGICFKQLPNGPKPWIDGIGRIEIKGSIGRLLRGAVVFDRMAIHDAAFSWMAGQDASENGPHRKRTGTGFPIRMPVIQRLSLRNISVKMTHPRLDTPVVLRIDRLEVGNPDASGPGGVAGAGVVNGEAFRISGHLGSMTDFFKLKQPNPVAIELQTKPLALTLTGGADPTVRGTGLNFHITARGEELSAVFDSLGVDVPRLGRFDIETTVTGACHAPKLTGFNMTVSDGARFDFAANGSVSDAATGKGSDVRLLLDSRNPEVNRRLLPAPFSELAHLRAKGRLTRLSKGFAVEDLDAAADDARGVTVSGRGRLHLNLPLTGRLPDAIDLKLKLSADDAARARPLLFDFFPDEGSVAAEAHLTGPFEHLALEDILIDVISPDRLTMQYRGRIGRLPTDHRPVSDIDLMLTVQTQTTNLLFPLFHTNFPELGRVSGSARLIGVEGDLKIEQIRVNTTHPQGLGMALKGDASVTRQPGGAPSTRVDLGIRIDAPNMAATEPLWGGRMLPLLGPVRADARLTGTIPALSLEDFQLNAGSPERLTMVWQGRIGKISTTVDEPSTDVAIDCRIEGKDTTRLSPLIGFSVPDLGPFRADWTIAAGQDTYELKDVRLNIGSTDGLAVRATGDVASVNPGAETVLDGIRLQVFFQAPRTRTISDIIGRRLPDMKDVRGRFTLIGNFAELALRDFELTTGSIDGFTLSANGQCGGIGITAPGVFRGVDIEIIARAPHTRKLPGLGNLPELGEFMLKARVVDHDDAIDIDSFTIRTGTEKSPSALIQGRASHVRDRSFRTVNAAFTMASQPWLKKFMDPTVPGFHRFGGSVKLSGQIDNFQIEDLRFSTIGSRRLSCDASGSVVKRSGLWRFNLRMGATASDASLFETMLNIQRPLAVPISMNGRIKGHLGDVTVSGDMYVGRSRINTNVRIARGKDRPGITAEVILPVLYPEDLGWISEKHEGSALFEAPDGSSISRRLFSAEAIPFQRLKAVDLDLDLKADRIVGKNLVIDGCDISLVVSNGRLTLGPSKVSYADGFLSVDAVVDIDGPTPEASVDVIVEDLDIRVVNRYFQQPWITSGLLNMAANLNSRGGSPQALASNLTGEIGMAIENGQVIPLVDMISADAIDMVTLLSKIKKFRELNCMALQIEFKDGIGTSQTLVFDTSNARATAKGWIDMGKETFDLVIQPQKKDVPVVQSSSMRIYGPILNPKVKKVPFIEAARLIGEILMPYYFLPARALGYIWSLIHNDPQGLSPCLKMDP